MPLPLLVPIGIGIAAVAAGGGGIGMTLNAKAKIKKAKAEHAAAYDDYKVKHDELCQYHTATENRLQALGQVRVDAMGTVRDAIDFIKRAKLVNPDIISDAEVTIPGLESLDQAYGNIFKTLGAGASTAGGTGVGALTAMGAYGLARALGMASTGAAIGGTAARGATLAWLGGALTAGGWGITAGAAVLSGIATIPIPIALGIFTQVKAGKVKKEAAEKIQELQVAEAEIARECAKLRTVRQRCDDVQRTVGELDSQLKIALQNAVPNIAEDVYRVVQIAKALRAAIDEPVIPANQR